MLDKDFFTPYSLAVIGASSSPKKLGHILVKNILDSGYRGRVYPVNPKEDEVLSLTCYKRVTDIQEGVDMALLVVTWQMVLAVINDCVEKGIKRVVIISAGFKEMGEQGSKLEKGLLKIARQHGMRMLGPNCLGFTNNSLPLNATFASGIIPGGNISLVAQSGAMRQSFWDWSQESGVGLSKFISLGNEADITETDVIEMLKDDDQTNVVIAYLEGIADGNRFRNLASSLTMVKPLIVVKAGSSRGGSRATISHTGSIAGADEIYDAVLKQTGVIRAQSVEQLFDFAFGLSCQPLLRGERLAVITNAGGPGVIASDAIQRSGLELAHFTENTISMLRSELPLFASLANPVDLTGGASADDYGKVLHTVLSDPNVDGALVVLCPQGTVDVAKSADSVVEASLGCGKPVFANFMGARDYQQELASLRMNGIPNYPSPERAVDGFKAMNQYRLWVQRKVEAPVVIVRDRNYLQSLICKAREQRVQVIAGLDAMKVLETYGIQLAECSLAKNAEEAVRLAADIGYPVVMKIVSPDIIHKTEFGGVKVALNTAEAVRDSYTEILENVRQHEPEARITGVMVQAMARGQEVILGLKRDFQFGAALMFGLGGIYTEVLKDVSFRVVPITRQDAIDMIHEIRSFPLLSGARGSKVADIDVIASYLKQLSQLAIDFPEIVELDINPLVVSEPGQGTVAVDCRIVID
jgi:acetyl coenzyme A synthetase (ADP forming)-like protein